MKHSSSGYGAIAQLGERVLCKHEVVGSIPSGSTRLRAEGASSGQASRSRSLSRRSPKGEGGPWASCRLVIVTSAKTSFRIH